MMSSISTMVAPMATRHAAAGAVPPAREASADGAVPRLWRCLGSRLTSQAMKQMNSDANATAMAGYSSDCADQHEGRKNVEEPGGRHH